MPLPRFDRAAPELRAGVLDAVLVLAETDGIERLALQSVLAEAGVSRSAGYNYFDGRDDLIAWAREQTLARIAAVLGPWTPSATSEALWTQFAAAEARLREHLTERPARRLLLTGAADDGWIAAVFADAVRLGLVTAPPRYEVLERATVAVIAALDAAELEHPGSVPPDTLRVLLTRLWGG